jgi:hypothetical protein
LIQDDLRKLSFVMDLADSNLVVCGGIEEALFYIGGYICHKVRKKVECASCKSILLNEKSLAITIDSVVTEYTQ